MSSQMLGTKFLEEEQNLLSGEDDNREVLNRKGRRSDYRIVLLVTLGMVSSAIIGALIGFMFSTGSKEACIRNVVSGSPLLEDLDISYKTMRFNGSLMKENVFRQKAGPEVDAAWEALGVNYRSVAVPLERARNAGLEPDHVKINPKYGGGYPANVEGLHQLHCLNLLRQALYYNFDYYHTLGKGAFKNDDHILQLHVSHCLDILRQQLMCTVDIGVLGQVWYNKTAPAAFVDFNTRHKCRNFDAVRQWAEVRQLPEQVPNDFLQPPEPGDTIHPEIP